MGVEVYLLRLMGVREAVAPLVAGEMAGAEQKV